MPVAVEKLMNDALQLPIEARAALAGSLLASLEEESDPGAEEAWRAEIDRRAAQLDRGEVVARPWDQVEARLRRAL